MGEVTGNTKGLIKKRLGVITLRKKARVIATWKKAGGRQKKLRRSARDTAHSSL